MIDMLSGPFEDYLYLFVACLSRYQVYSYLLLFEKQLFSFYSPKICGAPSGIRTRTILILSQFPLTCWDTGAK